MTEITHQWKETIEELKQEPLSEGIRDYLKNFWTRRKAAAPAAAPIPTTPGAPPSPIVAQKYIDSLNVILNKHQKALLSFIDSLNLRSLKHGLADINFRQVPPARAGQVKQPQIDPPVKPQKDPAFSSPPGAKTPFTPPGSTPSAVPTKIKKKSDLPHNSIFTEARSREWKPRIQGLTTVISDAYEDVLNFVLELAMESRYTPKNTKDLKALLSEMKHFTILDKKTIHIIRIKVIGFLLAYRKLEGWLKLYQQAERSQSRIEKKAAKRHIP